MSNLQNKIYSYFDRDPELRVLFVFKDEFIALELEQLTWRPGYRYVDFKGDWFTTKYMLDTEWADEKIVMFFHQESPLENKSLQPTFPLTDVLTANAEYHHQDYAAFVQQYNIPDEMAAFVEKNIAMLQSDKMLKLLTPYYDDHSITTDIAARAFLSAFFNLSRVHDWDSIIIRLLLQGRESETAKQNDFFIKLSKVPLVKAILDQRLNAIFGCTVDTNTVRKVEKIAQVLKYNAITQNLAISESDNYRQLRIADSVSLQQINRILQLALSTPRIAKDFVDALRQLAVAVKEDDIIRLYGGEANYYYMSDEMAVPIIKSLVEKSLESEPAQTISRIEDITIRRANDDELSSVTNYITTVAKYYEYVQGIGSIMLNTPNDYVRKYKESYYLIDQLYRQSIASFYKIDPEHELFDVATKVKENLNYNYSKTVNRINLEWTRCISESGGMGAVSGLRQQDFYDEDIMPIQKKVVVIISDALRYEVARELMAKLVGKGYKATIDAGIAMLPTETKYCKPALLPHRELQLYTAADGSMDMSVDEKILSTIAQRSEQLASYKEGARCIDFKEISDCNKVKNRKLFEGASLVYVFHDVIDKNGHGGTAQDVVDSCQKAIEGLFKVISHIHESLQRTEIWITSDHGFLFNDQEFDDKDKIKITEQTLEKTSRYYLTKSDAYVPGIVKYPISEVSGMDAIGVYVAVPEGTNRISAPSGGYKFAHGGASLEEILIPIVVSLAGANKNTSKPAVGVEIFRERPLSIQSSRLRFKMLQTEAVGEEYRERTITVGLYYNDNLVSPLREIQLNSVEEKLDHRKIQVDLTLSQKVDAKVLQLKVYDKDDSMNPLLKENVPNNTLISNDFDD